MTNEQALARAQHELNFYRQVKKDGVTMTDNLDFWEKIVEALESNVKDAMTAEQQYEYEWAIPILNGLKCPQGQPDVVRLVYRGDDRCTAIDIAVKCMKEQLRGNNND